MKEKICPVCLSDRTLPLASLRLLVSPVQLAAASVWRVLKRHEVLNYWNVAEFVSLVMETVPELLTHKHMLHLDLGLRARVGSRGADTSELKGGGGACHVTDAGALSRRHDAVSPPQYILELCRSEQSPDVILSNLEKIRPQTSASVRVRTSRPP